MYCYWLTHALYYLIFGQTTEDNYEICPTVKKHRRHARFYLQDISSHILYTILAVYI